MNMNLTLLVAYAHLKSAFQLIGDADLFLDLCHEVEYMCDERIEEEYSQSILDLCLTGK